jgi:hypothetical protein
MKKRNLNSPDERRTFEKMKIDIVSLEGITFARGTFNRFLPGRPVRLLHTRYHEKKEQIETIPSMHNGSANS